MGRERLGLLIGQADEKTQALFIQGFMQEAYTLDFDVCVFSMQQKYQETPLRDIGDSNIFNLVNYDLFAGIVIMKDTIQSPGVANDIEEKLYENYKGPVIVIDQESKYYETVRMNHRVPVQKLVDHLIDVHGYKNIVFLNGRKGHPHSVQRLQGYMDSMTSHNIPVTDDMIFYGDYWYDSGDFMVEELVKRPEGLPDAIACANDCMAIGVCDKLSQMGYKVPDDVAVIGYDSNDEGRLSPVPLTSADIPAKSCGIYAVRKLFSMLNGQQTPPFEIETELFIGNSCGCRGVVESLKNNRADWETETSKTKYFSTFNHIMDDLLAQNDAKEFFYTVFRYVYQIRNFTSFSLCLNDTWDMPDTMINDKAKRHGYTRKMCRLINCGSSEDGDNEVSFTETFDSEELIPELMDDRENPTTFFFTPLFFEDRSFGYSVISYGDETHSYNEIYRLWIRSVTQGMESFHRQKALRRLIENLEATQIRDTLTGLYNYKGFLKKGRELSDTGRLQGRYIVITAVDLNRLREINAGYGRDEGDEAIITLSTIINSCIVRGEITARMGNDEFVVGSVVQTEDDKYGEELIDIINNKVMEYNEKSGKPYKIEVCCGSITRLISNMESLEHLVNDTVSLKNGIKQENQRRMQEDRKLSAEDRENDELVKDILDNNRFLYHFQPIVNAKTGNIFAYEALMRADIEKKISPPVILQSAERMGRLYDVEHATFFNVLDYIEQHEDVFTGKKVFINSIPGCQLTGEDREKINEILTKYQGKVVVEFTEETEINDEQLLALKKNLSNMNIETAIDDYGSGYSNVNNLLRYMPQYVKIDRMLITEIHDNPQKQHFVKDIIEFAHDNDILALAEGVETTQEMKEAIKLGVDLIQGYYTAKPAPQPIVSIVSRVFNEILQYNQNDLSKQEKKVYNAAENKRISLIQLAMNKYTMISIGGAKGQLYDNREVFGGSGFESNMVISIEDNYKGKLTLDSVNLAGEKGMPCLTLGENCKLLLSLKGDSKFRTGGILVPESSSLTIEGDGNLDICINNGRYYGIGNDLKSRHGALLFKQDGCISIEANGMKGIGIGSGLGGEIAIKSGAYNMQLNGQDGIGIGAVAGDSDISIEYCDMEIQFGIANGAIIGSCQKNANIFIENISGRFSCSSNIAVCIGTMLGEKTDIALSNVNISINMMASGECYGLGGGLAKSNIDIKFAQVYLNMQAKKALAMGDINSESKIEIFNSSIDSNVTNNLETDMGVTEENIHIINGKSSFIHNNEIIFRDTKVGDL